mgnify:CR=1 FL=1
MLILLSDFTESGINEPMELALKDRYNKFVVQMPTLEEAKAFLKEVWDLIYNLESKIKTLIEKIEVSGNTDVIITLSETTEYIYATDDKDVRKNNNNYEIPRLGLFESTPDWKFKLKMFLEI